MSAARLPAITMNEYDVMQLCSVTALLASAPFLCISRFLFKIGHPTFFQCPYVSSMDY
jgi:hypothetical protein